MADDDADVLLAEQIEYYRAVAPEYPRHALTLPGVEQLVAAVEAFAPHGEVLELACGPGTWTPQLLRHAAHVTAVDAAPEMLALARTRVGAEQHRVQFVQADLFSWRPERRYDAVFFGFWLSHVPEDHFESFWGLVDECLLPDGRVMFVDDGHRTDDELIDGPASSTIQRRRLDGTPHRIVKVPHTVDELRHRLTALGWDVTVSSTDGPFYVGSGTRAG